MAHLSPFAGLRYDAGRHPLASVTAPPYDVIGPVERAALGGRSAHQAVHVDLPEPDEAAGLDRYAHARRLLEGWQREGVLVADGEPVLYGYRMAFVDETGSPRRTTGVLGALELSRPDEGDLLPHEHTTPKAKSDRLDLLRATRANLSPIWGLSPATGLTAVIGEPPGDAPTWSDDEGVEHTLWVIADRDRIAAVTALVATAPVVIADGHHRYETCLAYRDERIATDGRAGPAAATLALVVELVADELTVRAIHRLLDGLAPHVEVATALDPWFELVGEAPVDESLTTTMIAAGALGLVEAPGDRPARLLRPRPDRFGDAPDLDSSRLDVALGALGWSDVTYQHGVGHVRAAVVDGRARAGVLLRPATVEQIRATADGGERMPPKTTFFHPKPRTGLVYRLLD